MIWAHEWIHKSSQMLVATSYNQPSPSQYLAKIMVMQYNAIQRVCEMVVQGELAELGWSEVGACSSQNLGSAFQMEEKREHQGEVALSH
jgi:hypothetical protein